MKVYIDNNVPLDIEVKKVFCRRLYGNVWCDILLFGCSH